jgi:pimeloyl-ACP methyl ester carboxylesterase
LRRAVVRGDGPDISLKVTGDGPALILLHGIGSSGMSWLPVITALANDYRLLIPDLRGHGKSAHPADGYLLDDYADDLERIVAFSADPRPAIIGHSLGGLTTITWAKRHPDTARAIVLEDMPLSGGVDRAPVLRQWADLAAMPVTDVEVFYAREHPSWTAEERSRRAKIITTTAPAVFTEMIDSSMQRPVIDFLVGLEEIRSPIHLIFGEIAAGGVVPIAGAERFAALGANFSALQIPGGTHSLHRDFTEQFLELTRAFLDGI